VGTSWSIRESSSEAGGLPFPFPAIVKSFIPVTASLLILQGIAMLLAAFASLTTGTYEEEGAS
jgi:TRAP-type mannitol/chloroaromatic compound transport system permease small subunit